MPSVDEAAPRRALSLAGIRSRDLLPIVDDLSHVPRAECVALNPRAERLRIERALAGDAVAIRALVQELTPVVQSRVARVLVRGGGASRGSLLRQDVADLTQDVLAALFAHDGRVLRTWDPEAGASLPGFIGMIAEREALSKVRSRRRSPMTEAPTDDAALERAAGHSQTENDVLTRNMLAGVLKGLERALSPLGVEIFRVLFVEEADVETACRELSMTPDALYQWRTRIRRVARDLIVGTEDTRKEAR
jgi:RNA polymerase sigma-70 factor (ECF subfamily)